MPSILTIFRGIWKYNIILQYWYFLKYYITILMFTNVYHVSFSAAWTNFQSFRVESVSNLWTSDINSVQCKWLLPKCRQIKCTPLSFIKSNKTWAFISDTVNSSKLWPTRCRHWHSEYETHSTTQTLKVNANISL